jgi:hypothetical protein
MDDSKTPKVSLGRLSKTPSWISLGFVLGALFVWLLPHPPPEVVEVPAEPAPPPLVATRTQPDFTEIEAVFAQWSQYAVWENERTEVALWDIDSRQYSRFYEVLRSGGDYYFRSIARLTRPVLTHGVDVKAPLLFTEPEARRQEWLQQKDTATWQAIQDSIRKATSQAPKP